MPLTFAKPGEANVIKKVGGREKTRLFLEKLGFVEGSVVTVVRSEERRVGKECRSRWSPYH